MAPMEVDRADGRTSNQLRPLSCTRNVLHRAHGSARWSQGDTIVLAAVFGPKAGTKKEENPEKASIEVIWKPKTGLIGKVEKEYEMILKRTLQSVCLLTIHPNTTTSVIVQVVGDDDRPELSLIQLEVQMIIKNNSSIIRAFLALRITHVMGLRTPQLLPCAINASCAALADAGIPLKYLAVAICCGLTGSRSVILDPTKIEEKVFSYSCMLYLLVDYFNCLDRGYAACAKISEFLRRSMESQAPSDLTKTT
ncbi:hypothetical protein ZIOFF_011037 [Zingiber officinale]|uniref:Exoribonuclease phosphorolytic domain-containing protein n=1 Tax=Zingiber officinale TaxID=94328 RepID=A0A8J5LPS2_ZINOF|nr:hypothetical protein ZIOFF_011037 [Zingiber officinale]